MSKKIHIRLASQRVNTSVAVNQRYPKIFTPGQEITSHNEFMRGHGTYEEDTVLKASVAGVREQVNNLISVRPLKSRYNGDIGDVVVGRITEVQQKKMENSVLLLSSVNLPGGELRRRSVEDEHMMRQFLQEGDLISAEVQSVYSDGSLSLHTRSLRYGKLSQGVLVTVFPSLIKRSKTHFHNLPVGASIILGNNGLIWICPTINKVEEGVGGFVQNLEEVIPRQERETIGRITKLCISFSTE
ncbi:hypothetical protein NQ317_002461 [Molorchus minor]|uniref:Ribosomal RNA-processing protein 4 n=1 Tax=Molorchus minor TaxID=1323400 RepID=A0ABQ9JHK0_9CUCU|nr:hypothetical protein NQ317_002461 [Molorchus minor]